MREARWWGRLGARAGCGQCLRRCVSFCSQAHSAVQRTLRSNALSEEADHGLAGKSLGSIHCEVVRWVLCRGEETGSQAVVCAVSKSIDAEE